MSRPTSKHSKRKTFRQRNYRLEYQTRKAKGLAAGKSVSAARGHPRATDLPKPQPGPIDRDSPLERALKAMRKGASQAKAAKSAGVSVEKLRRHRLLHTTSQRRGREWILFDLRPQLFWIASGGRMKSVTLPNEEGSAVGHYWSAVNEFLATNDASHLEPYIGQGVRDIQGRFWPFEVGPNTLRKLDSIGELHFLEIYADVAK